MKKIKVYLQYPWKFSRSAYTKSLIDNPPKEIEYQNIRDRSGAMTSKRLFLVTNQLKRTIRFILSKTKQTILNTHISPKGDYDLIHCALCLSNNNIPWVADVEGAWQFFIGDINIQENKKIEKILLSNNCKKILPWTDTAKKEIIKMFPEIKNKVEVVYPAIPLPKSKKNKHEGINLVYVARYFDQKGGYHALEVMKRLTKKYNNVKGIIVSNVPKEIIEENKDNKKITFYPLMPQKEVFEKVYSIADISIYPAYADSFGFGILEAMSFGVPIISVDGYARKEIITEGKTGFIIDFPKEISNVFQINQKKIGKSEEKIILNMIAKTEELIKNKILRMNMAVNCLKEIKYEKFSITKRNIQLNKIYTTAIQ